MRYCSPMAILKLETNSIKDEKAETHSQRCTHKFSHLSHIVTVLNQLQIDCVTADTTAQMLCTVDQLLNFLDSIIHREWWVDVLLLALRFPQLRCLHSMVSLASVCSVPMNGMLPWERGVSL